MKPAESHVQRQPLPASSLLQMLMVLTMLGIVFAFWVAPPIDSESRANRAIEFANHEPLVAVFDEGVLRVIDAETGKVLYRGAAAFAKDNSRPSQRPWYCWPATWTTIAVAANGASDYPVIEFWSDDKALSLVRSGWKADQPSTIVHLPTQSSKSLANDQSKSGTMTRLVQIDEFVVAVQMPQFSMMTLTLSQNKSDYQVLWACNPATLATDISEAQKERAINCFILGGRNSFDLPKSQVRMQSKVFEGKPEGIEVTHESHELDDCWPTGDGKMICGFEKDFSSPSGEAQASYWLVDEPNRKAKRVHWPFHEGDVLDNAYGLEEYPLVVADLITPASGRVGVTKQGIAWNVATGKVVHIPSGSHDVKPFGNRLLMRDDKCVWWFDLESGSRQTVVNLDSQGQYNKYAMVGIWLVLWICLVRPMRDGDLTRRFGVALMLLLTASLSMGQLDSLYIFHNWPAMEWVSCASPFLPIVGLLWAGWSRRCVSGLLLTSGLGMTLLLLASLLVAGETYDAALSRMGGGNVSVRSALWMQLQEAGAMMTAPADPSSTAPDPLRTDPEYHVELISEAVSERAP